MQRQEFLERYDVKNTLLNLLLDKADVMQKLKVGQGKAVNYNDKMIFLILIASELHHFSIPFKQVNHVLTQLNKMPFSLMKTEFGDEDNFMVFKINKATKKSFVTGGRVRIPGRAYIDFAIKKNTTLKDEVRGKSRSSRSHSGVLVIDSYYIMQRVLNM